MTGLWYHSTLSYRSEIFHQLAFHFFVDGHIERSRSQSSQRYRHFHVDVSIAARSHAIQNTRQQRIPKRKNKWKIIDQYVLA